MPEAKQRTCKGLYSRRIRWLKPEEYLTLFTYASHFSIFETQPKFIYLDPVSCVYFIKCNALEFPRCVSVFGGLV